MAQVRRAAFLFLPRARALDYVVSTHGRARSARGRVCWPLSTVARLRHYGSRARRRVRASRPERLRHLCGGPSACRGIPRRGHALARRRRRLSKRSSGRSCAAASWPGASRGSGARAARPSGLWPSPARGGFCPSCGGRRMAQRAAHLVDHVLPDVPIRQWVLTLPHRLRYDLAWRHDLCRRVARILHGAIERHLRA